MVLIKRLYGLSVDFLHDIRVAGEYSCMKNTSMRFARHAFSFQWWTTLFCWIYFNFINSVCINLYIFYNVILMHSVCNICIGQLSWTSKFYKLTTYHSYSTHSNIAFFFDNQSVNRFLYAFILKAIYWMSYLSSEVFWVDDFTYTCSN